ncbi:hypothetical protein [Anaerosphaera multitolerans]|uniref:Uncharacterized protein n=1 Tax=Anaerosphaera multitolerans TaxID=2487351 RepID=A0A437S647_9FIRM|nr:hypothetical protein [Anaerosphaera multitolerans]RVU54491.1 hypothetical protein EF514_06975 [Anaerosphaera multitolerans]
MTNNQKRAHDLAIKCIELSFNSKLKFTSTDADSIYQDLYRVYVDVYDEFLEALNRSYPDGMY